MHLAVVILYTAGLRRGELARLTLDDVQASERGSAHQGVEVPQNPVGAVITDRQPGSAGLPTQRLAAPFDTKPDAPLLCCGTRGRHGYTGAGLGNAINRLFLAANVTTPKVGDHVSTI